jgi:hypothetical protein
VRQGREIEAQNTDLGCRQKRTPRGPWASCRLPSRKIRILQLDIDGSWASDCHKISWLTCWAYSKDECQAIRYYSESASGQKTDNQEYSHPPGSEIHGENTDWHYRCSCFRVINNSPHSFDHGTNHTSYTKGQPFPMTMTGQRCYLSRVKGIAGKCTSSS